MRVVVTGLGTISPLGIGTKHNWTQLLNHKSGIISTQHLGPQWQDIPCKVVGKVPSGSKNDNKWDVSDHFNRSDSNRLSLFTQYALVAAEEAIKDAKIDLDSIDKTTVGVNVGSGIGSFQDTYDNAVAFQQGYKKVQPFFIPKILTNMAGGNISIKYQFQGPNHAVATACATGLHAIGDSYNFIKNGYAKMMISGSSEASIHPLALLGFARAKSVVTSFNDEPEKASRPFDKDRGGFVLGEGTGVLVVESLDHALDRGVKEEDIYAEMVGYGLSGDGHHITAPPEDGKGAALSMRMALKHANITPKQVDYINAHATSTKIGDKAENNAIRSIFPQSVSVSSTKSSIGHLLGAAGSVESIFTILAVKNNQLPPTLNLQHLEPDFQFDYVPQTKSKTVNYALNNSFGFGGVNSSIIFKKFQL